MKEPNLIIRLSTESQKDIDKVVEQLKHETIVLPEAVSILIKTKEGYWKEIKEVKQNGKNK